MTPGFPAVAVARHFALTLRLNFRSRQAILYGFVMPVLFLLSFGAIFRGDTPLLRHEMGQLLTISILGGACFGLPTALVSERERGLWRRYRLLPASLASLLVSTVLARLVLLALAALLQVGLARLVYGTPLPVNPGHTLLAFLFVAFAFLGLGLVVAAVADDVPAVQALGQCLFLPMIMLGGVGVPLDVLPVWAQAVAGFMPGRYAVETLQRSISDPRGLSGMGFALAALAVIGASSLAVGTRLFRWDSGQRAARSGWAVAALALVAWIAVGAAASALGRVSPVTLEDADYRSVTAAQMKAITYDDLPGDSELATRLAPVLKGQAALRMEGFRGELALWAPGLEPDRGQVARNLLSVAAIADLSANLREAEIARVVFDLLQARCPREELKRILAWIILSPEAGSVVLSAPELGLRQRPPEAVIRQRVQLYAKKLLGRLVGSISDGEQGRSPG